MNNLDFYEEQKIDTKWLLLILGILFLPPIILAFTVKGGISISILIALPIAILLFFLKLKTQVNNEGITMQFIPIIITPKKISWEEIQTAVIRNYKPIWEYGGWGLRVSFKHGTAYTVKGKTGLQLTLKNGKQILIGTQKPDELQSAINKYLKS